MLRFVNSAFLTFLLAGMLPAAPPEPEGKPAAGPPAKSFCVVAYLPDYHLNQVDPDQAGMVTDLIYFSIETKPTGELDDRRVNAQALKKLHEIKKLHKNRLLVSVSGWGRSKGFAHHGSG